MVLRYTIEIGCPPEKLFPYLQEPDKLKLWMKGLIEDKPTSEGPTRVGSTFEMTFQEGRKIATYQGEVTAYEPNKLLGIKMSGEALRNTDVFVDYKLTDLVGRTRLDYECRFETDRVLFKLMSPLFNLFGRIQVRGFLKALKRLSEGAVSEASTAT